jgi:hypothetical protein
MNTYRWILLSGATLVLAAACVVDSGTDEDDTNTTNNGGSGGTGNTTTTGGTGGTGGGTGGGATCDTGTPGDINNGVADATCQACLTCAAAVGGPCEAEFAPCEVGTGEPCDLYLTCVEDCETAADLPANGGDGNGMLDAGTESDFFDACVGDPAAPMAGECVGDQAAGFTEFLASLSCGVCSNCEINCNAAANCQ